QGKGIGKMLTQQCIDYSRSNGEKVIALHTSEFMDAARNIYEKMGFKKEKELDRLFGKRYWLYLMELK
ncbi:MAG: GNAT family N-acetyltransferase, partial [Bacteroidota bacterium]